MIERKNRRREEITVEQSINPKNKIDARPRDGRQDVILNPL